MKWARARTQTLSRGPLVALREFIMRRARIGVATTKTAPQMDGQLCVRECARKDSMHSQWRRQRGQRFKMTPAQAAALSVCPGGTTATTTTRSLCVRVTRPCFNANYLTSLLASSFGRLNVSENSHTLLGALASSLDCSRATD